MEDHSPELKEAITEIVSNQLLLNDPPETRQTLDRLVAEGYSTDAAMELIGVVVTTHIYEMLKKQQTFDLSLFVQDLEKLPEMPWSNDE